MDEMYGLYSTSDYAYKCMLSPENLMIPAEYQSWLSPSGDDQYHRIPMFGSDELISAASTISEAASTAPAQFQQGRVDEDDDMSSVIKSKIACHPCYPKLIEAYIDCQKVGAPPEIARLLDEIRTENDVCKRDAVVSTCLGSDPELDEFMENYCDILVKFKSDLKRPFDEATTFLNKLELQLGNLCKDESAISSEEEYSGEIEGQEAQTRSEDRELKDKLLRAYGNQITSLKLEFSKKKKKGKLPKEARQTLLEWWNVHYKWPYPTEADKISLAESTGLDQKQINNWFINQRKRHWNPSENMQLAVMDNISGQFFSDD